MIMHTKELVEEAVTGIQSDKETIRDKHFKTLLPISRKNPERLYPYWDIFLELLRREPVLCKYVAIHLLANLTRVDTDKNSKRCLTNSTRSFLTRAPSSHATSLGARE